MRKPKAIHPLEKPAAVREFVNILAVGMEQFGPKLLPEGFLFPSCAALLLEHGVEFTERIEPPRFGKPKECFNNAMLLMLKRPSQYRYCEGWALSERALIPVSHGWCVDILGRVVDPTWPKGLQYFGVIAQNRFAVRQYLNGAKRGYFSLLDAWWDKFPILRTPVADWKETKFP